MRDAVIIDVVRTPLGRGKVGGQLNTWHPVDLAAHTLKALVERTGVDPALIEDVIMGCVSQTGEQGSNVARNAALNAGFPHSVVGTTVDRQCGSSQQALHFAAQGVMAGAYDVVVASGVESMSRVPMFSTRGGETGEPFSAGMEKRFEDLNLYNAGGLVDQGISAEIIAEKWGLSREDLDAFGYEKVDDPSQLGDSARQAIRWMTAMGPVVFIAIGVVFARSVEKLATLKPVFKDDGVITAANSSQITDGSSAALVMGADKAKELGLRPRARFHAFSLAGCDPVIMLAAPIPATQKILEKAGLKISDIDIVEINEAFAPVVLAWAKDMKADLSKVNRNGGAIAIGHPLGATGTRLTATLLNDLERVGGRYGLQTLCEGGGMANATIIERLD
jgi:acetyl-CoA acetyltransferase family protein